LPGREHLGEQRSFIETGYTQSKEDCMGRTVISRRDVQKKSSCQVLGAGGKAGVLAAGIEADAAKEPDKYMSRLIKYIPGEIIALYIYLETVVRSLPQNEALYWSVFTFCFLATPLYLWRKEKVSKKLQLLISTISFFVWVFAVGGPFASLTWYNAIYGVIGLPVYTFLVSLVEA
jgi:hypothetical protein